MLCLPACLPPSLCAQSEYIKLLAYIPNVTRNEGSTAIDDVLNAVGGGGDLKALEEVYAITIDSLKKQKESGVRSVHCALLLPLLLSLVDLDCFSSLRSLLVSWCAALRV